MNKPLNLALFPLLLLGACNKNKQFNKSLNGTWAQTSLDGNTVASGDALFFTFTRGRTDDGNVYLESYTGGTKDEGVSAGTYKISGDGTQLKFTATGKIPASPGVAALSYTYEYSAAISGRSDNTFTAAEQVSSKFISGNAPFTFTNTQVSVYERR